MISRPLTDPPGEMEGVPEPAPVAVGGDLNLDALEKPDGVTLDPEGKFGPLPLEDARTYLDGWFGRNDLSVGPNMLAWALQSTLTRYEALAARSPQATIPTVDHYTARDGQVREVVPYDDAGGAFNTLTAEQCARRLNDLTDALDAARSPQPMDVRVEPLWQISKDGPNEITTHRRWLARQLMDSKLTDDEAFGIVRHSPAIASLLQGRKDEGGR